jgi:hypothetical protein
LALLNALTSFLSFGWDRTMLAKDDNSDTRLEGFEPTTLGSED